MGLGPDEKIQGIFFTALGLVFVHGLLSMINAPVQGKIVDEVIINGQIEKLLTLVLIMIGSTVLRAILRYTYLNMFEHVSQNVVYNARRDVFRKVQELDFDFSTVPRRAT